VFERPILVIVAKILPARALKQECGYPNYSGRNRAKDFSFGPDTQRKQANHKSQKKKLWPGHQPVDARENQISPDEPAKHE